MTLVRTGLVAVLLAVVTFAVSTEVLRAGVAASSKTADDAAPSWTVGTITGKWGSAGGQEDGTDHVSRPYGQTLTQSGNACNSSWPQSSQDNRLRVALIYEGLGAEPVTVTVNATVFLTDKQSDQKTVDWSCPGGPPTWDSTCVIKLYKPAPNNHGNGTAQAGTLTQQFTHAPPTGQVKTEHHLAWDPSNPLPGYNPQDGSMAAHTWNVVPDDEGTHTMVVTAKCTVDWIVPTALEITVDELRSTAKAKLQVTW